MRIRLEVHVVSGGESGTEAKLVEWLIVSAGLQSKLAGGAAMEQTERGEAALIGG